jgi:pantoate--beta-alanine ligase
VKIFKSSSDLTEYIGFQRDTKKVGFVPTMGALHEGHLQLIRTSKKDNDITVCSIFVNPTQFNRKDDFEKYPRTLEKDLELLEDVNCDAAFVPTPEQIYPKGPDFYKVTLDLGHLGKILEATHRPGHFEGVVQVVYRLFEIVRPHSAYFGKKDYQQCKVIEKLGNQYFPEIHIKTMPTVREPDGLAMSSRNQRLSEQGRKSALNLFLALSEAADMYKKRVDIENIKQNVTDKYFTKNNLRCEYFEIASKDSLLPLHNHEKEAVILTAVWVEDVRLIDNMEAELERDFISDFG